MYQAPKILRRLCPELRQSISMSLFNKTYVLDGILEGQMLIRSAQQGANVTDAEADLLWERATSLILSFVRELQLTDLLVELKGKQLHWDMVKEHVSKVLGKDAIMSQQFSDLYVSVVEDDSAAALLERMLRVVMQGRQRDAAVVAQYFIRDMRATFSMVCCLICFDGFAC